MNARARRRSFCSAREASPHLEQLESRHLLSVGVEEGNWWWPNRDIPDNGCRDNYAVWEGLLEGAPPNAVITDVDIEFWIDHTWIGDLEVWLTTREGGTWYDHTLWDRSGGSDDDIHAYANGLDTWDGLPANRTWYFCAADCAPYDTGEIDRWKLRVHWWAPDADDHADYPDWGGASTISLSSSTGNGSRSGTIETADDSDLFKFTAAGSGTAVVDISTPSSSLDSMGWAYSSGYSLLDHDNDAGPGTDARLQFSVVEGRTYYVRVEGYGSSTGTYTVVVDGPDTDDHADYPDWGGASTISLSSSTGNGSRSGTIETADDSDLFKFTAAGSGTAVVDISTPSSSLDSMGWAYSSGYSLLDHDNDAGPGTDARLQFSVVEGRTYYVRVEGYGSSTGTYTVVVDGPPRQSGGPDLVGTYINAPEVLHAGTTITEVSFIIQNQGDTAVTQTFWVRICLSGDRWIGPHDFILRPVRITDDFAPGQSRSFTARTIELPALRAWAPLDRAPDTYYIGMMVDVRDQINESNENNNRNRYDAVTIDLPAGKDLVGIHFDAPENLVIGEVIPRIDFAIVNQGRTTVTENFYLQVRVSRDRWIGPYDEPLGRVLITENLSPGEAYSGTIRNLELRHWPGFHGSDHYFLGMWIDPANRVREQFEANNRGRRNGWDRDRVWISSGSPMPDPDDRSLGHADSPGGSDGRPDGPGGLAFTGPSRDIGLGQDGDLWRFTQPAEPAAEPRGPVSPDRHRVLWSGGSDIADRRPGVLGAWRLWTDDQRELVSAKPIAVWRNF